MEQVLAFISDYLAGHTELAVFLCLGLGYMAGKISIGTFRLGATVGTLLVSLLVGQLADFSVSDQLKSTFFLLFSFVLGYESGPAFFANLRTSGIKSVFVALFYGVMVFLAVVLLGKVLSFDTATTAGLLAGAQTQSSVLGVVSQASDESAAATVAFALTYIFGTAGTILFMKKIGPAMMGINLRRAVKEKMDREKSAAGMKRVMVDTAVQVRAYRVEEASSYDGQTVEELEKMNLGQVQIARLFRDGRECEMEQDTQVLPGDVITVVGKVDRINMFDNDHLTEMTENEYLQLAIASAELIVTAEKTEDIEGLLSSHSVLIRKVIRAGKEMTVEAAGGIKEGDHLLIAGPQAGVKAAARKIGYLKSTGDQTDVSFFSIAIVLGIILGSFAIDCQNVALALGASGGALLMGLFCGYRYHKNPKHGYISSGARWLLKSLGLNVFIAATALNAAKHLGAAVNWGCIPILLAGAVLTLLPHVATIFFARRALKMDAVDTLGSLCGSATCTAALNALIEDTESASFAASYSPAYAVGNILLTLIGIAVSLII